MFSTKLKMGAVLSLAVLASVATATVQAQAQPTTNAAHSVSQPATPTPATQWQVTNPGHGNQATATGTTKKTMVAASIPGIGVGVWTNIPTASIFQCPETNCNQGEVPNDGASGHPDDVAAICILPTNSPWGNPWTLVLDHSNNETGFLDLGFIYDPDPNSGGQNVIPPCDGSN